MGSITPIPYNLGPLPPYPLHHSIKDKLDPVYRAFYDEHISDKQQVHLQPVEASRTSGVLIPGGGKLLKVGSTKDYSVRRRESDGPDVMVRVFTPEGERSEKGWPVVVYYHGGGWVLGNIDTENVVCTNLCKKANCIVISVDYRYVYIDSRLSLSLSPYPNKHFNEIPHIVARSSTRQTRPQPNLLTKSTD
ncbi:hypothetical protein ONS95_009954 [Cadophora gregata]|uniref:uncharacterized protein n=1 Tax=Cadophora gregata TaxID=51156 RepID=UPI0026DCB762|nr:uncharacterized protein ONS95_009954 [Cadophora gregata]KAK0121669.1 hypothetical protein ONS95_009954 [Cadophora gregata]